MIALFGKAMRAAIRREDPPGDREPHSERRGRPAQDVIDAAIMWTASDTVPNTYEATLRGQRWQLRVDQSNQGTRFILLKDGAYVREDAVLPPAWIVPG